jgi:hypothetical protein
MRRRYARRPHRTSAIWAISGRDVAISVARAGPRNGVDPQPRPAHSRVGRDPRQATRRRVHVFNGGIGEAGAPQSHLSKTSTPSAVRSCAELSCWLVGFRRSPARRRMRSGSGRGGLPSLRNGHRRLARRGPEYRAVIDAGVRVDRPSHLVFATNATSDSGRGGDRPNFPGGRANRISGRAAQKLRRHANAGLLPKDNRPQPARLIRNRAAAGRPAPRLSIRSTRPAGARRLYRSGSRSPGLFTRPMPDGDEEHPGGVMTRSVHAGTSRASTPSQRRRRASRERRNRSRRSVPPSHRFGPPSGWSRCCLSWWRDFTPSLRNALRRW